MTDKLSQQEVNATAWAACDTFRGVEEVGVVDVLHLNHGDVAFRIRFQTAAERVAHADLGDVDHRDTHSAVIRFLRSISCSMSEW